jgi:hypothetical protein
MSEYKLTEEIIKRSQAQSWDAARLEWGLEDVYFVEDPETCLCGHYPIKEICTLRNTVNGQSADVGNCCVKKFLGLPSDKIFQAVKRVKVDWDDILGVRGVCYAVIAGGVPTARTWPNLYSRPCGSFAESR